MQLLVSNCQTLPCGFVLFSYFCCSRLILKKNFCFNKNHSNHTSRKRFSKLSKDALVNGFDCQTSSSFLDLRQNLLRYSSIRNLTAIFFNAQLCDSSCLGFLLTILLKALPPNISPMRSYTKKRFKTTTRCSCKWFTLQNFLFISRSSSKSVEIFLDNKFSWTFFILRFSFTYFC